MAAYYNENDPFAAQWLRNLISKNLIAPGDVDERSILDVAPDDLKSYRRCHFFAGIGGWDYALQLAAFPSDREVWTGSCPCQPFSAAGQSRKFVDERHLWPYWYHLIAQRKPATLFGEQVASKAGLEWFDLVWPDLEAAGYAVGVSDLGAASVGAPHIRQRLWFVAGADGRDTSAERLQRGGEQRQQPQDGGPVQLADSADGRHGLQSDGASGKREPIGHSELGDANEPGSQGRRIDPRENSDQQSPWSASDWLPCTDGKVRPVEPGTFPLAHGIPGRVGRLRAYGNAIVPQVAAAFVEVAMRYAP